MELKANYIWPDGYMVKITIEGVPGKGHQINHRHCVSGWSTEWSSRLPEKCRLFIKTDDAEDYRWESIDSLCIVTTEDTRILQKTKLTISSPGYRDDITLLRGDDVKELLIACRKATVNN